MAYTENLKLFKHDEPLSSNENEFDIDKSLNDNWDIVDETCGDLKGNAETLQAEYERLQKDFNDYTVKGIISGESINVTDSSDLNCDLKISGNDVQEVTEQSANILDLTKLSDSTTSQCTVDDKKANELTLTSTANATSTFLRVKIKLKAGTWYFKREYEKLSDTDLNSTSQVNAQKASDWSMVFSLQKTSNVVTFTLNEDTEIYLTFILKSSQDNSTDIIKARFYNLMFSTENIDYTPFIPDSPSRQYSSLIKTVKNKINTLFSNRNLAKIDEASWTLTNNNTIENKARNHGKNITIFKIKRGQTVKVNLKLISKPAKDTSFSGYIDNKNNNSFSFNGIQGFSLNQVYTRTYTATKDCEIKYTLWGNPDIETFEIQFWAELNNVTDYIVHQEQNYEMTVQQEMLEGDYLDFENKKEIHSWEKKILNGTEGFSVGTAPNQVKTTYFKMSYINDVLSSNAINCKCENLKAFTGNNLWNQDAEGIAQSKSQLVIRLSKEVASTEEELNQYLAENNITVYCKKTETELAFTETQKQEALEIKKARTYKNVTNVMSTDEVSPIYELTYKKDLETLFNQLNQLNQGG